MSGLFKRFFSSESGAVTVDWVVLTASVVGLGMSSVAAVRTGTNALGDSIEASLMNAFVAGQALAMLNFDDTEGLRSLSYGWRTVGEYAGWTATGIEQGIEILRSGRNGITTPDGGNMLDLDASPGNLAMAQVLDNMSPGGTHSVSFNAADVIGNNGVDVYFGGELIGSVDPGGTMDNYSFDFVEGSGDGSNELVLQGTGPADNIGAYIHGVEVY